MSKAKAGYDPAAEDAARVAVNGPAPVTAQTPLSGEREVLIDEVRGVAVDFHGRTDEGVKRITVTQLPGWQNIGGPPQAPGVKTVTQQIAEQRARREQLIYQARAEVIPSVHYHKTARTCSFFTHRGGNYEHLGQTVWCVGQACPSLY